MDSMENEYRDRRIALLGFMYENDSFTTEEAEQFLVSRFGNCNLGTHDSLEEYLNDLRLEGYISQNNGEGTWALVYV